MRVPLVPAPALLPSLDSPVPQKDSRNAIGIKNTTPSLLVVATTYANATSGTLESIAGPSASANDLETQDDP